MPRPEIDPFQLPRGNEVEAIRKAKEDWEKFKANNPYVSLLEGTPVLKSNIALFVPYVLGALELLIRSGRVAEQKMLFPERPNDSMLFKI